MKDFRWKETFLYLFFFLSVFSLFTVNDNIRCLDSHSGCRVCCPLHTGVINWYLFTLKVCIYFITNVMMRKANSLHIYKVDGSNVKRVVVCKQRLICLFVCLFNVEQWFSKYASGYSCVAGNMHTMKKNTLN